MNDAQKQLLRKIGEETIYTSKGYFKCFDSASIAKNLLLWLNLLFMVAAVALSMFDCCAVFQKVLTILSLLDMILILYLDGKCSSSYLCSCQKSANDYLAFHKKVRDSYYAGTADVERIAAESRGLDARNHPRIHMLARFLSKRAIECKGEVDMWFREG